MDPVRVPRAQARARRRGDRHHPALRRGGAAQPGGARVHVRRLVAPAVATDHLARAGGERADLVGRPGRLARLRTRRLGVRGDDADPGVRLRALARAVRLRGRGGRGVDRDLRRPHRRVRQRHQHAVPGRELLLGGVRVRGHGGLLRAGSSARLLFLRERQLDAARVRADELLHNTLPVRPDHPSG